MCNSHTVGHTVMTLYLKNANCRVLRGYYKKKKKRFKCLYFIARAFTFESFSEKLPNTTGASFSILRFIP